MGRRRDLERYEKMKRLNPDYKGFRGHQNEPDQPGKTPLESVTWRICGRKRNVAVGIALEQGSSYVCVRCSDEDKVPDMVEAHEES